jgi:hypothetical protein
VGYWPAEREVDEEKETGDNVRSDNKDEEAR